MIPNLLVLSHGEMAAGAVRTAETIVGRMEGVVSLGLSSDMSLEEFRNKVRDVTSGTAGEWIVLVDLYGGSCAQCAALLAGDPRFRVISGFNLAMIMEYALSRERLPIPELVGKITAAGKRAITEVSR